MDVRRRPRPIVVALGLSLMLHLAGVPFVRSYGIAQPRADPSALPVTIARRTPVPTPRLIRPTPAPPRRRLAPIVSATHAVNHARTKRAHSLSVAPHLRAGATIAHDDAPDRTAPQSTAGGGGDDAQGVRGAPEPIETVAPSPAPVVSATCATPHDATVVTAVTPERPAIAAEQGALGRVEIRVDLDERGVVYGTHVYRSSGNGALDAAALAAAGRARYAPASDGCTSIGGSYIYAVDFSE